MFANACTTSMTKPAFQWKCFAGGERRAFSACTSALAPASSIFPKTNLRSARTSSDSAVDAPTALGDRRQRCLTTVAPSLSRPAIMTLRSTPTKHPAAMRRGSALAGRELGVIGALRSPRTARSPIVLALEAALNILRRNRHAELELLLLCKLDELLHNRVQAQVGFWL